MPHLPNLTLSRLTIALGLAAVALGTQAQTIPNAGDALRQSQLPQAPQPPQPALPKVGGELVPPMQALPQGGQTAHVTSIRIEGNRNIATDALLKVVADAQGKDLTLAQLEEVASRLTRYYRGAGYFVARAYVPAQDLTDGVLTLRVVEGNYGQFKLHNTSLVRDDVVQGLLDDIKDRDVVSLDTLERAMLIINDTPGVRVVRADVMPGERVGTSDFAIGTVATPAVAGFVIGDNYGSTSTGRNRASFNIDWNSPTGAGDRLSLSGLATNGDLFNGRLAYSRLARTNGTRAGVALSQTNYSLGGSYAALDATGRARNLDVNVSTPWKRTQQQTINAGLTLSRRQLVDEIHSTGTRTPKNSTSLTADLQIRTEQPWFGREGTTVLSTGITTGHLAIDDEVARSLDAAGPHTQGTYAKWTIALARDMFLSQRIAMNVSLKGQVALTGKALDGSERLSVSGADGVMAYGANELAGDTALVAHLDVSASVFRTTKGEVSALLFTDTGYAKLKYSTLADPNRQLSDVGIGLVARSGQLFGKLNLAHRTSGAPVSEPLARTRLLLQVGTLF